MKDPYEALGVARTASADDIRKAYRALAKKLHPDLNPGDKKAEERFKEISTAYGLLSDAEKRKRFDAGEIDASGAETPSRQYYKDFAHAGGAGGPYRNASGFADFADGDDVLAEFFRRHAEAQRHAPGADLQFRLTVPFLDAINGAKTRLSLPHGGTIDVTIPAGVREGQVLRLKGKGAKSMGEGPAGDALVEISIEPHPLFQRAGDDIAIDLPVTVKEAVLGAKVRVPTPRGPVMLTVPKNSNNGAVLRLKGKGAARHDGHGHGDQLVRLKVVLPSEPDADLEAFLAGWTPKADDDPRKGMPS